MVTKHTTKEIEKSAYKNYWIKAMDFYEMMETSMTLEKWNSVGLQAVHSTISATDALLAYHGKIRSTSPDHMAPGELLKDKVNHPETPQQANRFRNIIATKNVIEYEKRLFTQKEAFKIKLQVERYFEWAKKNLPPDN